MLAGDEDRIAATAHPIQEGRSHRALKRAAQVATATLVVAGCPVAAVWWLRASGTVTSPLLALALAMVLSLLANWVGQALWEKRVDSEDLLFNELMVWGYVHRRLRQRRLESTDSLVRTRDSGEARRQRRLLEGLVSSMEKRDPYLHGHSRRVARYSWLIAQRMKLPREQVAGIRTAAALHDVGKTKTPKSILHKPGRLTDEEYRIIQLHPGEGAEMAAVLDDPGLVAMIRHHHERLDGTGYPDGLAGEAIPLGARIIAVADTFDAITSARAYRPASAHKRAIDILREESGARLDGDVVKAFCDNYSGRRPLALWSFVCGMPERVLSWLSGSVGAAASAAKVVAVSAIVGAAAATGSALGVTHSPAAATARHELRTSAPAPAPVDAAAARTAPVDAAAPARHSHVRRHRVRRSVSAPASAAPTNTAAAPAPAPTLGRHASGEGAASRSGGEEHRVAKHEAPTKAGGPPKAGAPPKAEAPSRHEEAQTPKAEEHAAPEAPRPAPAKEEASSTAPVSTGGGGEGPAGGESTCAHGKSCEAPGHNK